MVETRKGISASDTSADSSKGKEKATPTTKQNKIFLKHACYICGNTYSGAQQTIRHIKDVHGYDIPSRAIGANRSASREYEYVKTKEEEGGEDDQVVPDTHYACPSCWFHCPEDDLEVLDTHINDEHDPVYVKKVEEEDQDDDQDKKEEEEKQDDDCNTPIDGNDSTASLSGETGGDEDKEDSVHKEIARKLEEITGLFKSFFQA